MTTTLLPLLYYIVSAILGIGIGYMFARVIYKPTPEQLEEMAYGQRKRMQILCAQKSNVSKKEIIRAIEEANPTFKCLIYIYRGEFAGAKYLPPDTDAKTRVKIGEDLYFEHIVICDTALADVRQGFQYHHKDMASLDENTNWMVLPKEKLLNILK